MIQLPDPAILTGVVILFGIILFVTEYIPLDLTSALIIVILMALGLITPEEGIAGFSNPATVTVAAVLVLSAGLQKTGVIDVIGYKIIEVSDGNPRKYLAVMMVSVGLLSAFINNTAAVAIFLPIVINSAQSMKMSPSKLLIPLSFASMFGGVCTLIGTSTNLLVNTLAVQNGVESFSMFEFTPLGIIFFIIGFLYFMLIGQRIIPYRVSGSSVDDELKSRVYMTEIRVLEDSNLVGKKLEDISVIQHERVKPIKVIRGKTGISLEEYGELDEGDSILIEGSLHELVKLRGEKDFCLASDIIEAESTLDEESHFVEALIPPTSNLIGRTLRMAKFEQRYQSRVIAIRRHGKTLGTKLDHVRLLAGDTLVIQGEDEALKELTGERNIAVITSMNIPVIKRERLILSLLIMLGVVGLATIGALPIVVTAAFGAVLMVVTGILNLDDAYRSISPKVIVILAASIAMATAMENSGLALLLANNAMRYVQHREPVILVTFFYGFTSLISEVLSNNASAVMMTKIALPLAQSMGIDPRPLLMSITYSASDSFMTPKGYQTNTMIYGPGGYRFTDYLIVGAPLVILYLITASIFIPLFWPL